MFRKAKLVLGIHYFFKFISLIIVKDLAISFLILLISLVFFNWLEENLNLRSLSFFCKSWIFFSNSFGSFFLNSAVFTPTPNEFICYLADH